MREMSEQAKVAKLCRAFLKEHKINGKCSSRSFSMGDSVDIDVYDVRPEVWKMLESEFAKYERGHFDGYEDMYVLDNKRNDIPQTKYLFVNVHFSGEREEEAKKYLEEHYKVIDEETAQNLFNLHYDNVVWRVLNGSVGEFWN